MGIVRNPSGVQPTLDPIALAFPWPATPIYAGWHGSTLARSRRNLAAPGLPVMDLTGAPTIGATGMVSDRNNYLSGNAAETAAQTFFIVARSDQDQSVDAMRMGMGGWLYNTGFNIFAGSATTLRATAPYPAGTLNNSLTLPAGWQSSWGCYAAVQEPGVGIHLHALTRGLSKTTASLEARTLSSGVYRIGAGHNGPAGQCQTMFAAIIPAAMTLAQLQDLRAAVSRRAQALHGITI